MRGVWTAGVLAACSVTAGLLLLQGWRPGSPERHCCWAVVAGPFLALALVAARWFHAFLCAPLEVLRSPDDVGYIVEAGRTRAQAANEARRRRKTGDLPPVYPNGWYRVTDSHLLAKGEVKSVTLLGEQLAVFRDENGQSHVLDAYCPHLGANLSIGGRVVGNCLECPFHGWKFRGEDGKCIHIPYTEKVPEFARVKSWPSCELNGTIYMWFHCDGMDPLWMIPELEEITLKEWTYRGRTEHFVNAHIEEIPENAADVAHLGHLHRPVILSGTDLRFTFNKFWQILQHHWKVSWSPEPEPNSHCSLMLVEHTLTLFGKPFTLLDVDVKARQIGPGLVHLFFDHKLFGRGVILHCVTPVEPLLQCVSHSIFYQANIPNVVPKFILQAERIQFERDVMVWNNKKYISKPLLVKEDSSIQRHRRWYSQFYSEKSPKLTFQRDSLDW
ncbi:cholesterol 7-desaturase nvd [Erpetoichthys calabaricus]|uniref:cholesterol 7-desaturase n=1 Tax=Erpetoichthys calabaricus TaxID=27687 RepID=A0A8C4SIN5_ERPCA|nr:cholesterol 7-desaturase nvd [Erpetoichthys calabaricus]